jgi:prepilin-type processing-associated H-X9-DG protein
MSAESALALTYTPEQLLATHYHPDWELETLQHKLDHGAHEQSVDATTIWISAPERIKVLSHLAVGVSPGPAPPQASWSPQGDAVAYLAIGDLFVTDLVRADATSREKLAAGEPLSCDEERSMATVNLKQLGLGLIQYIQDYDERLPPAGDVHDRIYPYVKDETMFSVGDSNFVYYGNGQGLGSFDSPATFVIGAMDTPCAHNVLYLDGHVRSFLK